MRTGTPRITIGSWTGDVLRCLDAHGPVTARDITRLLGRHLRSVATDKPRRRRNVPPPEVLGWLENLRRFGLADKDGVEKTALWSISEQGRVWLASPPDVTLTWAKYAACSGQDPDLFFPSENGGAQAAAIAKRYCAACMVRDACYAVGRYEECGVWGGTTPAERRAINRAAEQGLCAS